MTPDILVVLLRPDAKKTGDSRNYTDDPDFYEHMFFEHRDSWEKRRHSTIEIHQRYNGYNWFYMRLDGEAEAIRRCLASWVAQEKRRESNGPGLTQHHNKKDRIDDP